MYRLAVCDDESLFVDNHRSLITSVLNGAGISFSIESFTSGADLDRRLQEQPNCFDMLLLDILFDSENGLELARALREAGYLGGIIFATSSKDFTLEGYGVYPVHYLLKPIECTELRKALLHDYAQRFSAPTLTLPVKGGYMTLPSDDILYIESLLRMQVIHARAQDINAFITLKEIKALLPSGAFLQCHKSFLVPMSNIRSITRSEILLASGQQLPVGRVYYAQALSAFIDYMASK